MPIIALLSPNQNAYSETFIQAHRRLEGKIKFYYGGYLPRFLEGSEESASKSYKDRGVAFIKRKLFKSAFSGDELRLMKSLKANRVNLVFAEYGPTAVKVLPVCKRLQLPLIVHFHGFDASHKDTLTNYSRDYSEVFAYASYVIGVSRKMIKDLSALGAPEEKLVYNPYGPDDSFFSVRNDANRKKFFSVGRFVEKKAPHLTLLAFRKVIEVHPNACLFMGGDGPLLNICKDLAGAWKMENNVVFLGKLSPAEVRKNMSDSLAFVQHSITAPDGDSEGTPVVILEAGAAGLPVISTYHAGIPDIVQNEETGFLVKERDVDGMASCMIQVLEHPCLAKKMGSAARARIRNNFTMERHIGKLNQLIGKALN